MKFGTIGTSWITEKFIDASKKVEGVEYIASYSRSIEQAKAFQEKNGAIYAYDTLEVMLENNEIDFIYIASPNSLHYEQALKCLEYKKHVICEKPIFSNSKELKHAISIAEKNGVYLFEAIKTIHSPNLSILKEQLKSIGDLSMVHFSFVKQSSKYNDFVQGNIPNIFNPKFSTGALMDLGVYTTHLSVALFGTPNDVYYFPKKAENGIDLNGVLNLIYDDFVCNISIGKTESSYSDNEILGTKQTIVIPNESISNLEEIYMIEKNKKTLLSKINVENDMIFEIETFKEIILNNDIEQYNKLLKQSEIVMNLLDKAREYAGIHFPADAK